MYYIILKKQNQDIGTKIKNLKIKNPINSSHRKKNWLVFFCSHWEETCSDLWEQWGRRVEVVILVKCPVFQQYKQRHPRSDVKTCSQQLSAATKNMCPIVAPYTGVSALIIFCLGIILEIFSKKFFLHYLQLFKST